MVDDDESMVRQTYHIEKVGCEGRAEVERDSRREGANLRPGTRAHGEAGATKEKDYEDYGQSHRHRQGILRGV
jgi:hypothetical protein